MPLLVLHSVPMAPQAAGKGREREPAAALADVIERPQVACEFGSGCAIAQTAAKFAVSRLCCNARTSLDS